MQGIYNDIKYAWRMLYRNWGFTAIAVLSLAFGIGANTSVFSVICAHLYGALPYANADKIIDLDPVNAQGSDDGASLREYFAWRDQNHSFDQLAFGSAPQSVNLTGGDVAERLIGVDVSANFFSFLGASLHLGRNFSPDANQPGKDQEAIVSYAFWQRKLGSSTSAVGQILILNGKPYNVVGVTSPDFHWLNWKRSEVFLPLSFDGAHLGDSKGARKRNLIVMGQLKPGTPLNAARSDMQAVATSIQQQYPNSNKGWRVKLVGIRDDIDTVEKQRFFILQIAAAMVLLITCANVANLLLVRATARQKEFALRVSLGAGRSHLMRQLLMEAMFLAVVAGLVGFLVSFWGANAIAALWSIDAPKGLDFRTVEFTVLVVLATVVVFGLTPMLQISSSRLYERLKEGGRTTLTGARRSLIRKVAVMVEISLALALSIGAGVMIKTFSVQSHLDPGFDPHNLLVARIPLMDKKYSDDAGKTQFVQDVLARVKSLPGVQSAAGVTWIPLRDPEKTHVRLQTEAPLEQQSDSAAERPVANYRGVTADYFRTLHVRILRGRDFTPQDTQVNARLVLVNQALAQQLWAGEDPVGKYIDIDHGTPGWRQVIGVVPPTVDSDLGDMLNPAAEVYELTSAPSDSPWLIVRSSGNPNGLAAGVRHAVAEVDRNQPVVAIQTMDDVITDSLSRRQTLMQLLSGFAAMALILAALGIYGVLSSFVAERRYEMGIRMALGAQRGDIVRLVFTHGMRIAGTGIAVGILAALLLGRYMSSQLYGVKATDPGIFAVSVVLLTTVALFASLMPARRASCSTPMEVLKTE
jgi:putative ABC transport system permease protein